MKLILTFISLFMFGFISAQDPDINNTLIKNTDDITFTEEKIQSTTNNNKQTLFHENIHRDFCRTGKTSRETL